MAAALQSYAGSDGLEPEVLDSMLKAVAEAQVKALSIGSVLVAGANESGEQYLWEIDGHGSRTQIKPLAPPVRYPAGTSFQIP